MGDDLTVRRDFPVGKALVAIVMTASLIAVSWMGLQIKNRRAAAMRQEAHETAISACDSAEATRKTIQSDLDRTTAKASRLLKDTSRGQVADPKTLDALNRLLDAKTSTAALRRTTKELKNRLTDLKTAAKAVTDSKLDKTVDDANALYKQTDGKVADDKTRASLLDAIKKRDADAIAKAVKEVNESKMAKEKADAEAKAKAEQEAAAAAAQQAQASQSQSQGSSGSGSETVRRPSSGGSSSSTNTGGASPGWSVPAPSDEGTGLPGSDPGL